jgi:flagellar basal body-associated protein FliL
METLTQAMQLRLLTAPKNRKKRTTAKLIFVIGIVLIVAYVGIAFFHIVNLD